MPTDHAARGSATYTTKELARLLGLNERAVYKGVREGWIPCIKGGPRKIVFPRAAIDRWLETAGGKVAA